MKFYRLLKYLFIAIMLSSCIELEEKITIKNDLSGQVSYQLNTSAWASFFSGFIDNSIQSQIQSEADKFIQKLKSQPGIRNVTFYSGNFSGGYKLSFDFDNYRDFNNALLAMGDAKKTFFTPGYLKVNHHRVKKINFSNYLSIYLKKENIEIKADYLTDNMIFKSTINLPGAIKKYKGKNIELNAGKTSVTQSIPLKKIIFEKEDTGINIRY